MTAKRPKVDRRLVWRAGSDQVAHAHDYERGMSFAPRGKRTLCGRAITDIRLAWTATRRCAACLAAEAGVPMVL